MTNLPTLCDSRYDAARQQTYLALDVPSFEQAVAMLDMFGDAVDGYKVGLQLFHADGHRTLQELQERGKRVFLDVKLHDIPNTVAGALRSICEYGIEMVNVHALGGRKMLEAARNAVECAAKRPLLIGVTVLTSLSDDDLAELNVPAAAAMAMHLARLAAACGLDGVVASALDTAAIRAWAPEPFEIVVPGTRPAWAAVNDQARSLAPGRAIAAGASRLVLGRAVTQAGNPLQALQEIWDEMNLAFGGATQ